MVVVEVRQRTLSPRVAVEQEEDEEDDEEEEEEEAGGGRRRQEEEEEEEDQATDIKSNNPHLAGGEQWHITILDDLFHPQKHQGYNWFK